MSNRVGWKPLALLVVWGGLACGQPSGAGVPPDFQDDERLIEGMDRGIQGDYAGAIAIFSELIRQYPTYAEAYFNRGFAKAKLKDDTGAIADYTLAIRYNPQFAEAYQERGELWKKQGNIPQTQQDWQTAAQLYHQQNNTVAYQGMRQKLQLVKH